MTRIQRLAALLEEPLLVAGPPYVLGGQANVRYLTGLQSSNSAVLVEPEPLSIAGAAPATQPRRRAVATAAGVGTGRRPGGRHGATRAAAVLPSEAAADTEGGVA